MRTHEDKSRHKNQKVQRTGAKSTKNLQNLQDAYLGTFRENILWKMNFGKVHFGKVKFEN